MKNLLFALLIALLPVSGAAIARSAVPIENIQNEPLGAPPGKTLSLQDVQTALFRAGVAKGWTIENTGPGQASGTLTVRNKHMVKVDIAFTEKAISIRYKDSVNMKHEIGEDGQALIHPFFNKWIRELLKVVNQELARL